MYRLRKGNKTEKKLSLTMCIIHCLLLPTYESPRGLSICDLFANFIT